MAPTLPGFLQASSSIVAIHMFKEYIYIYTYICTVRCLSYKRHPPAGTCDVIYSMYLFHFYLVVLWLCIRKKNPKKAGKGNLPELTWRLENKNIEIVFFKESEKTVGNGAPLQIDPDQSHKQYSWCLLNCHFHHKQESERNFPPPAPQTLLWSPVMISEVFICFVLFWVFFVYFPP